MTIYVDTLRHYPNMKNLWCHMATDGDIEELHTFAANIGLRRERFQNHSFVPHYDLTEHKRDQALQAGAIPVATLVLAKKCRIR